MQLPPSRTLGILAGVVAAAGALTFVAASGSDSGSVAGARNAALSQPSPASDDAPGEISGPCDEAEHANDPQCAGVAPTSPGTTPTTPTTSPTTAPAAPAVPSAPAGGTHTLPTPGGTVTYSANATSVSLVSAVPADGWRVEVEQASGREVELDFRSGSSRIQVNLEIEDGHVRERVRVRDDAGDTDVRFEDGAVRDDGARHDGGDDDGGDNSGSGSSGSGDDDSGSGSRHSGGSDDD
jgi:hypothetical protein